MCPDPGSAERGTPTRLGPGDALVVVDVQNDFVTGSLAVPGARDIVPVINRYIARFRGARLQIVATRDWHPVAHVSFRGQGGPWPPHCIAGTPGAAFATGLALAPQDLVVSKAMSNEVDAYSGFESTALAHLLRRRGVRRIFVAGLATDYCVAATVRDALDFAFRVCVLVDAIRSVDLRPGDGARALETMEREGAVPLRFCDIETCEPVHG